jgi:hypothetical protein
MVKAQLFIDILTEILEELQTTKTRWRYRSRILDQDATLTLRPGAGSMLPAESASAPSACHVFAVGPERL